MMDGWAGRRQNLTRRAAAIGEIISEGDITGRLNRFGVIYPRGSVQAKRIVVVGLGKRIDFSLERLRGAYATAAQHVRSLNVSEMSTALDFGWSICPSTAWQRLLWKG